MNEIIRNAQQARVRNIEALKAVRPALEDLLRGYARSGKDGTLEGDLIVDRAGEALVAVTQILEVFGEA